jgi:hypothetical protein
MSPTNTRFVAIATFVKGVSKIQLAGFQKLSSNYIEQLKKLFL